MCIRGSVVIFAQLLTADRKPENLSATRRFSGLVMQARLAEGERNVSRACRAPSD